jgi:hypothetical protein
MMYLIGNPTYDILSIKKKTVQALGGTVWYAALFIAGLGRRVAVVGIGDERIKRRFARSGVDVRYFSGNRKLGPAVTFSVLMFLKPHLTRWACSSAQFYRKSIRPSCERRAQGA